MNSALNLTFPNDKTIAEREKKEAIPTGDPGLRGMMQALEGGVRKNKARGMLTRAVSGACIFSYLYRALADFYNKNTNKTSEG